jgi:quercetin dioxygenase-like cupin family protein
LGEANVRRHALGDGRRHARLQLRVALDAARKGLFELEAELRKDLAKLLGHLVVADEHGAHYACLDHASFGEVPIARQHHPALGRSFTDELGVADARVIGGVVAQSAQPACKAPDVAVSEESRLHNCNLRIVTMPSPDELMTKLRGEASGCYSWSNGPGDRYAPHSHGYEKVLYCVEGSITFNLEAEYRRLELKVGDRMVLPAGTVHSAEVGQDGCTCIEGRR